MIIKRNAVRCDTCLTVIESSNRHDFRWCDCERGSGTEVAVDGGRDYLKRSWGLLARFTELSEQTCPGCGCITPANEPTEQCGVCKHAGCRGCIGLDGLCDPCHDIEKERNG